MLISSPFIVVVIPLQEKRCACSKIHFTHPVASGRTTLQGTNLITYVISWLQSRRRWELRSSGLLCCESSWPLKMGQICCAATSARYYHYSPRKSRESAHFTDLVTAQTAEALSCVMGRHGVTLRLHCYLGHTDTGIWTALYVPKPSMLSKKEGVLVD